MSFLSMVKPVQPVPPRITVESGPRGIQIVVWEADIDKGQPRYSIGAYSRKGWIPEARKSSELAHWVGMETCSYSEAIKLWEVASAKWKAARESWLAESASVAADESATRAEEQSSARLAKAEALQNAQAALKERRDDRSEAWSKPY